MSDGMEPVNRRLMKVRMRGKHTSIIQCYTPISDSDEETKGAFYEQLQSELEQTPWHDLKIVMGELNAKVGNDNTNYDRAMGSEGWGTINDNGKLLLELCTFVRWPHYWKNSLPTPWHTQDDLVFHQWKRQEPDQQLDGTWRCITPRCLSEVGSQCQQWPPHSNSNTEIKTGNRMPTIRCGETIWPQSELCFCLAASKSQVPRRPGSKLWQTLKKTTYNQTQTKSTKSGNKSEQDTPNVVKPT